jgi:hypothetical protein
MRSDLRFYGGSQKKNSPLRKVRTHGDLLFRRLDNLLKSHRRKLVERSILARANGLLPNPASGSRWIVQSWPSNATRKFGCEQSTGLRWWDYGGLYSGFHKKGEQKRFWCNFSREG